ncbi:MAG: 4-hydroxybenzoate octaprenyltransferase [Geminicoccaceae bacterium]
MARQVSDMSGIVADRELGWMDRYLPAWLRPYGVLARWDRPIGAWLLLWPCWWGQALAPGYPSLWLAFLFLIGAIAMRGAGCTINDMTDRNLDAKVDRTQNRPLASGALTLSQAMVFLGAQLLVGLAVLTQLNVNAALVALAAMPLVVAYPWMKRITWWPQLFLGITFKWGALVGWTAATGSLGWPAVILYIGGIFWTLGYDTIYAHQDKDDDALIGVKSTARRLGDATPAWLWLFYGISLLLLAIAGALVGMGWLFYVALLPVAAHFAWQIQTLDIDDPDNCLARFRSNREAGLLVMAALLLGKVA